MSNIVLSAYNSRTASQLGQEGQEEEAEQYRREHWCGDLQAV